MLRNFYQFPHNNRISIVSKRPRDASTRAIASALNVSPSTVSRQIAAVDIKAVKSVDLERVIVDSTVQSKTIAHTVDSRLLEIARHKVDSACRRCGITRVRHFHRKKSYFGLPYPYESTA